MDIFYSLNWSTNSTTSPIKWCYTGVTCLCFPFTLWNYKNITQKKKKKWKSRKRAKYVKCNWNSELPTRWSSTAHSTIINMLNLKANKPCTEGHIFVCILVQELSEITKVKLKWWLVQRSDLKKERISKRMPWRLKRTSIRYHAYQLLQQAAIQNNIFQGRELKVLEN